MNTISKKTALFSGIMAFLAISIPSAHAITFDEQTCMSLLSIEQVKTSTGFEDTINVRTINADMTELNDDLKSGCVISFEHEDNLQFTLALSAVSHISEEDSREKYIQTLSQMEAMGFSAETFEENGWEYYIVEINQSGLGSALASIKGDYLIGFNAPGEDSPIEPSALMELIKIVHANIDGDTQESTYEQVVCPQGMEPIEGKCPDKPVVQSTIEPTMIVEKQLSPKKQISQGIQPGAVKCNEGFELITKNGGKTSACVKPATIEVLEERGWGGVDPPCCKK